ncbi:hypothetical protein DM02DRAFT_662895 [Periconia macrospinosa]|uniref:Uncharacterized protein n=1 Tax=Periconia macrospinosa TaxID=97972 RepID=A0A2V1D3B9_9PLEO|nr:hypothetical protein DM02DRAFT_662895 [Periconia macrospinosa]
MVGPQRDQVAVYPLTQNNFGKIRNKPGNPANSAKAQVTGKMMDEIFPNIRPGLDEYQSEITTLPSSVFRGLVTLLDESQGAILREFSAAVPAVVEALVWQLPQHEPFNLETVESSDIVKLPKRSNGLSSLIR